MDEVLQGFVVRERVLFVGSFREKAKDGSVGGQMFACRSLIQSDLSNLFSFSLLDSTAQSVPPPALLKRLFLAVARFSRFCFILFARRPQSVLIFSSASSSFIEKGLMALVASRCSNNVIFAPRSGLLIDDIKESMLFKAYARAVFRSADSVICQGQYWKDYFENILGPLNEKKLKVVPNWIDVDSYPTHQNENCSLTTFVYIGWLEEYKGIRDLIEAARLLQEKNVPFRLQIYGDGRERIFLENCITTFFHDGHVTYGGWLRGEEKIKIMRMADVIVLPSHREGFPNALLEAMAYQKAVIASNIGVIPEIIEHGINGLTFDSGSPAALAESMEKLIADVELIKVMGIRARRIVEEKYSIASAVGRFKSLLRSSSDEVIETNR